MIRFPKTVLFVSHDASRTGAPIFLLRFLRWLRDHHQIPFRILVVSPGEMLPEFERVGPTYVFERQSRLQRAFRRFNIPVRDDNSHYLESVRKSLSECNIGLIYSNTMATGKALDYLSFLDCPVLCHVHELEQAIQHCDKEDNLILVKKHASAYVAVSHAVQGNLVAKHGIPEDKIKVIHGFVPTGWSARDKRGNPRRLVRRELRIPIDAKLVCACGSVEPRKGPDLFLQVADKFAKMRYVPPAHFVWIGGNREQVEAMRQRVRELSRQDVVHFIGRRADVSSYYHASDVFLLTSREDPFPLVMMEAALRGNPIVCFDNSGGAPEFVQDDAGFVVRAFDVDEMAERLALLLSSDQLRRRMGEAARQRVLRRHDINTSAPQLAEMIQSALISPKKIDARPEATVAQGKKFA
jgi:glycosyltransferase involved in cell wall biosynthesis